MKNLSLRSKTLALALFTAFGAIGCDGDGQALNGDVTQQQENNSPQAQDDSITLPQDSGLYGQQDNTALEQDEQGDYQSEQQAEAQGQADNAEEDRVVQGK